MTAIATPTPHGVSTAGRPGSLVLLWDQAGYASRALWRTRIVLVFTFVLPLAWLVVIGLMAGNATVDESSGVRVMQFATPMAAALGVLLSAYPPVAYSLALAREQKIAKRLQGTPLPPWAFLGGRVVAAAALSAAAVVAMLAVGVAAYGVEIQLRTLPATIATLGVGIACLAALGLAIGANVRSGTTAQNIAMATGIGVAFLSGLMTFGLAPPAWMDTVAAIFPVRYILEPLRTQFNPFLPGDGWDVGALAILAAWGFGGLLVAAWGLRREAGSSAKAIAATASTTGRAVPHEAPGRPRPLSLVLDQVGWANTAARRDFGWVFFAVAMPVGLYALMASQMTGGDFRPRGMSFAAYFAVGMAAYGASITAFINMPEAVARARDRALLKRLRGTPLDPWQYLAGRTVSVLWIGLLTGALVFAVGALAFGVQIVPERLLPIAAVFLLGTLTLAACGFALVALAPSGKAIAVIGLAVLLPLSFISDIFPFGGTMPEWITAIGAAFPLVHFAHALAGAVDPAVAGIEPLDLVAMAAWLIGSSLVAIRWFRWEARA